MLKYLIKKTPDDDTANDDDNDIVVRIWVHTDSIKYQWSWHLDCNN
jgi:hypothetical protein